jgi:ferric-dicitrate binding protein FerR (iron transport regulator)
MKTRAFASCCACLLGTALLGAGGLASAAEKAGDVVSVRGTAVIERKVTKAEARVRSVLLESDSIMTQERSRVKMLFRDDSVLTLGPKSRLVIRKYLHSPENKRSETVYELADGKLRSVVGSPGFRVMTPTAFAAARGTIINTTHNAETGTTEIAVLEGEAEVRNANAGIKGVQIVKAGFITTVTGKQPPTKPRPLDTGYARADEMGRAESGLEVELLPLAAKDRGGKGQTLLKDAITKQDLRSGWYPSIDQVPVPAASGTSNVDLNINFPR